MWAGARWSLLSPGVGAESQMPSVALGVTPATVGGEDLRTKGGQCAAEGD